MFFASPQGGPEFAVIDWQIANRGGGVFDVAYFVSGTLTPEERRSREHEIVKLYHDTLVENGVKNYSFDQCWQDYRLSTLFLLPYSVIGAGSHRSVERARHRPLQEDHERHAGSNQRPEVRRIARLNGRAQKRRRRRASAGVVSQETVDMGSRLTGGRFPSAVCGRQTLYSLRKGRRAATRSSLLR